MITNDAALMKLRHDVLVEVARLAWDGRLEEERDEIPYRFIPGPLAQFRCCIYKEREIIRQRVRLAEGKTPSGQKSSNVVQVIGAACEECPIASYIVTDNCRTCLGKACQNSCRFGAITMGDHRAYIDPTKCKECGKCAQACPYSAIAHLTRPCSRSCPVDAISYDEYGLCVIDEEKCIRCGACIHNCPFGAIGTTSDLVRVIEAIRSGKRVVAMLAPATEGQFGEEITMASWKIALKKTGFADMVEVGLGGDLTAASEAAEWAEAYREGKKLTTSCCPAFVNMIRMHFPAIADHISTTVSPMCGVSRFLKQMDPETVTVFVGPCIAKKSEAKDQKIEGNADFVLTYGEIRSIMYARDIELEPAPNDYQESSIFGKRFANGGGVSAAVMQCLREMGEEIEPEVAKCSGGEECRRALLLLKAGRLPEDFIEGMACEGGCVGGPSRNMAVNEARRFRDNLLAQADKRGVLENLRMTGADRVPMRR